MVSVSNATISTLEPRAGVAMVRSPDETPLRAQPCPRNDSAATITGWYHRCQGTARDSKGITARNTSAMPQ